MRVDLTHTTITADHNRHADQTQQHTAPTPDTDLILEHKTRQHRAEQWTRLRQHARRPGADALLADVQRDVMQADREETQGEQQWYVPHAGKLKTFERGDDRHEQRRQQKPQQRQMPGIVGLQADVDAGWRIRPAADDKRHGQ